MDAQLVSDKEPAAWVHQNIYGRRTYRNTKTEIDIWASKHEGSVLPLHYIEEDEVIVNRADLQESLDEYNAPEANNRLREALK